MTLFSMKILIVKIHPKKVNGLLPDDTKPLRESMLTYHEYGHVAFTWWQN